MQQINIDFGPGAVVRLQDQRVIRVSEVVVEKDWDNIMSQSFTDEHGVVVPVEEVKEILLPYEDEVEYYNRKPRHLYQDAGRCTPATPAWAEQWLRMGENILGAGWSFREESGKDFGIGWRRLVATGQAEYDTLQCDACGDRSPQLHYYGVSDKGETGICNSCMTNMQVLHGVFQPLQ